MESKQVAIIVDAAVELHPQRLTELGVLVVPRRAKIGRHHQDLTAEYTGYSVVLSNRKPRNVILYPPSYQDFKKEYVQALISFPQVLSIHLPTTLDEAAYQARLARNLSPEAQITVFESPLLGIGLARLVETAAEWAQEGATLNEITNFIQENLLSYSHSLFIGQPSRKLKGLIQTGDNQSTSVGLFAKTFVALSVNSTGYFKQEGRSHPNVKEVPAELQDLIERIPQIVASRGAYLNFFVRQIGMEEVLSNLRPLITKKEGAQEQTEGGWSPLLSAWLGKRYVEICTYPTNRALNHLKTAWESTRKFEQKARASRTEKSVSRLSDVRLK